MNIGKSDVSRWLLVGHAKKVAIRLDYGGVAWELELITFSQPHCGYLHLSFFQ